MVNIVCQLKRQLSNKLQHHCKEKKYLEQILYHPSGQRSIVYIVVGQTFLRICLCKEWSLKAIEDVFYDVGGNGVDESCDYHHGYIHWLSPAVLPGVIVIPFQPWVTPRGKATLKKLPLITSAFCQQKPIKMGLAVPGISRDKQTARRTKF